MDGHALERLGHHIVSRRVELGYRNRTDLAASLKFTVRTLADIENGVRKASPGTYAMLENKLAWAPGSIDTILAGGEPKEVVVKLHRGSPEPRHRSFTTDDALAGASTEELLLELRRRIIRPAADAARAGTTGTASTRGVTGPTRASQHRESEVLEDAVRPVSFPHKLATTDNGPYLRPPLAAGW
jgi:hypothetical protein